MELGGGVAGYGVSYGDRTGQELKYPWEDGTYFLGKSWETVYTDSVTSYAEAKMPDISKITVTPKQRDWNYWPYFSQMTPDDYDIYCHIPDSYNLPEPLEPSTQGFAETDLETGWYSYVCFINKPEEPIYFSLVYNNQEFSHVHSFITCEVFFLVIDHKIIQFEEWKPKDFKSDFSLRTEGDKVYVSCYSSAIFLERFFSGRTEIVISNLE